MNWSIVGNGARRIASVVFLASLLGAAFPIGLDLYYTFVLIGLKQEHAALMREREQLTSALDKSLASSQLNLANWRCTFGSSRSEKVFILTSEN
jgi:hypothetical protein